MNTRQNTAKIENEPITRDYTPIVNYNVTMLIAAGAAMAANCEPCLNKIIPDLIEAGVAAGNQQGRERERRRVRGQFFDFSVSSIFRSAFFTARVIAKGVVR